MPPTTTISRSGGRDRGFCPIYPGQYCQCSASSPVFDEWDGEEDSMSVSSFGGEENDHVGLSDDDDDDYHHIPTISPLLPQQQVHCQCVEILSHQADIDTETIETDLLDTSSSLLSFGTTTTTVSIGLDDVDDCDDDDVVSVAGSLLAQNGSSDSLDEAVDCIHPVATIGNTTVLGTSAVSSGVVDVEGSSTNVVVEQIRPQCDGRSIQSQDLPIIAPRAVVTTTSATTTPPSQHHQPLATVKTTLRTLPLVTKMSNEELIQLGLLPPPTMASRPPIYPSHLPFVRCCYDTATTTGNSKGGGVGGRRATTTSGCAKGNKCYHLHSDPVDRCKLPTQNSVAGGNNNAIAAGVSRHNELWVDRPHFNAFNNNYQSLFSNSSSVFNSTTSDPFQATLVIYHHQHHQRLPCHYGMNCRNPQHRQCAVQHNFHAAALEEYELYLRRFRSYEFECIQYHHTVNRIWRSITDTMVKSAYLHRANNNNYYNHNTTATATNNITITNNINNNINHHKNIHRRQKKNYVDDDGRGDCAELSHPPSRSMALSSSATATFGGEHHQLAHHHHHTQPQEQRRLW